MTGALDWIKLAVLLLIAYFVYQAYKGVTTSAAWNALWAGVHKFVTPPSMGLQQTGTAADGTPIGNVVPYANPTSTGEDIANQGCITCDTLGTASGA